MQGVVLAAGEGTRLRLRTNDRPKSLVEVNGTPLLTWGLSELVELEPTDIVIVVGYRASQIMDFYGESFEGVPLTYAHQAEQRGVAHAVLAASEYVSGPFMLIHGDYVFGCDIARIVTQHRRNDFTGTILVDTVPEDEATGFGVCEFDAEGALVGLVEKPDTPPSNVVVTGFFVFEPAILAACRAIGPSARGEYELPDALDYLLTAGHDLALDYIFRRLAR